MLKDNFWLRVRCIELHLLHVFKMTSNCLSIIANHILRLHNFFFWTARTTPYVIRSTNKVIEQKQYCFFFLIDTYVYNKHRSAIELWRKRRTQITVNLLEFWTMFFNSWRLKKKKKPNDYAVIGRLQWIERKPYTTKLCTVEKHWIKDITIMCNYSLQK